MNHLDSYIEALKNNYPNNPNLIRKLKNPDDLPEFLWSKLNVERYPDEPFDFGFTNNKQLIIFEVVWVIIFISLSVIFSDLISYFP